MIMKRYTLITLLFSLLAVGAVALWRFMPRKLNAEECSTVYRHFADMHLDGVSVVYIRDKKIDDTLRLPVTVLHAETDRGWQQIDSIFGYARRIEEICGMPDLPDSVKREFIESLHSFYGYHAHRDTPETVGNRDDIRPDDIAVFIFLNRRCVTIYEPTDFARQYEALSSRAIANEQELTQ